MKVPGVVALSLVLSCAGSTLSPEGAASVIVVEQDAGSFATVFVTVVGDGAGLVHVGDAVCNSTCRVDLPSGSPVSISAEPDAQTFPPTISGGCEQLPCVVMPPASVQVKFLRGRLISLSVSGGPGRVLLNGELACDKGDCRQVVQRDVELNFTAEHDDYSSFERFAGDCSNSSCAFPPGNEPVTLSAHFTDSLVWSQQIDALEPVVSADEVGLLVAFSAKNSVQLGNRVYRVEPNAAPDFGVVASLDWDGGVRWATALNAHRLVDGAPLPRFDDVLRLSSGESIAVGACRQGGRLNGLVDCEAYDTPFSLQVGVDGGMRALAVQAGFGQSAQNQATLTELHELDAGLVAFRGVGWFAGLSSGALGFLDGLDGGFSSAFSLDGVPSDFQPLRRRCTPMGEGRLLCSLHRTDPFQLDACIVAGSAGTGLDPVLLVLDSRLRCVQAARIRGPGLRTTGLSASDPDGGVFIGGMGPPVDFGGGLATTGWTAWVARWSSGGVTALGASPVSYSSGASFRFNHVEPLRGAVLVQADIAAPIGGVVDLYGQPYTGWVMPLVFLDPVDLQTPLRRWDFRATDQMNGSSLMASRLTVVGDRVVLWVTGVDVKFGDRFLSQDGRQHSHLVVLRNLP